MPSTPRSQRTRLVAGLLAFVTLNKVTLTAHGLMAHAAGASKPERHQRVEPVTASAFVCCLRPPEWTGLPADDAPSSCIPVLCVQVYFNLHNKKHK